MSECTTPDPCARKGFFEPGERVRVNLSWNPQKCEWFEGEIARFDSHTGEAITLDGDLIPVHFSPVGVKVSDNRWVVFCAIDIARNPNDIEHLWETPTERAAWRAR